MSPTKTKTYATYLLNFTAVALICLLAACGVGDVGGLDDTLESDEPFDDSSSEALMQKLGSDNFNRPNSTDLGGAWSSGYDRCTHFNVASHRAASASTTVDSLETFSGVATPNDQWAEATLSTFNESNSYPGVLVRFANSPTFSGYECRVAKENTSFGASRSRIAKWTNGKHSRLVVDNTTAWEAGDKIRCVAQGSTIQMYQIRGSTPKLVLSTNDSSFPSGKTGLLNFGTSATFDNFKLGAVTGTAPPPPDDSTALNCKSGVTCATLPLKLHSSKRFLVGANDAPYFIQGDSAWFAMARLSPAGMDSYFADRKQRGFNAVIVDAVEKAVSTSPRTADGLAPFKPEGTNYLKNFFKCADNSCSNVITSEQLAYWQRLDAMLAKARNKGIAVFLSPSYYGHNGAEGFSPELAAATAQQCYHFGFWLGNRYKSTQNIVWVWGGDNEIDGPADATARAHQVQMMQGLRAGLGTLASKHLHTIHFKRTKTSHDDYYNYPTAASPKYFLDGQAQQVELDAVYTNHLVTPNAKRAYNRSNVHPTFLYEAYYEGASLSPYNHPQDMRRQAYTMILSGGAGHFYGHSQVYCFGASGPATGCSGASWQPALSAPGTLQMKYVRDLFEGRHWNELKPDFASSQGDFVVGGSSNWKDEDDLNYIARARTSDGKTAVAYVPNSCGTSSNCAAARQVVVTMTKLGAATPDRQARWFNPTNGSFVNICGQKLGLSACGTGDSVAFTTPGGHPNEPSGAQTNDWILLIEG